MRQIDPATGLPEGYPLDPEWEVSPRHVRDRLRDSEAHGQILLIDCRRDDEVATARIEGAVHIPMDQIPARLNEIDVDDDETLVVIHCHHGRRSLSAASVLKQNGIDARSMAGGIDVWSRDIDTGVPRY